MSEYLSDFIKTKKQLSEIRNMPMFARIHNHDGGNYFIVRNELIVQPNGRSSYVLELTKDFFSAKLYTFNQIVDEAVKTLVANSIEDQSVITDKDFYAVLGDTLNDYCYFVPEKVQYSKYYSSTPSEGMIALYNECIPEFPEQEIVIKGEDHET